MQYAMAKIVNSSIEPAKFNYKVFQLLYEDQIRVLDIYDNVDYYQKCFSSFIIIDQESKDLLQFCSIQQRYDVLEDVIDPVARDLAAFSLLIKIKTLHSKKVFHGDIKPSNVFGIDNFVQIVSLTTDSDTLLYMDDNIKDQYYVRKFTRGYASEDHINAVLNQLPRT